MSANAIVRARIDERVKDEAAVILGAVGLTISDAVRMMLVRTVAEKALPFDPLVPNAETIAAMKAARRGDLVTVGSVDDLLADLHADDTGRVKPSAALRLHRAAIRRVVESHRACNPRIFGSVVRGKDVQGSDLDILIDPTPDTTLFDIGAIRDELHHLLGVPVDVLTPKALPDQFRDAVLAEAVPV